VAGGEGHQSPLASFPGALERHEAEHRVLDDVRRERVHDHAEQFRPADALAAQDADDGVVAGHLEVPRSTAAGNTFADFSPDGSLFVACPEGAQVLAWDTRNLGRKPDVLADEVPGWSETSRDVAFSPDGRFVSITEPNGLSLWRRN
jgi:hypothetical protein